MVKGFNNIVVAGVNNFETLFKDYNNLYLLDVMKITQNFPSSVYDEENDDLLSIVTIK